MVQTKTKKHQKRNLKPTLVILSVLTLIIFGYWYISLSAPNLPSPPLKDLAATHKIALGIHVNSKRLNNRIYPVIASSQFAFVTIDGGAHFKEVRPSLTQYDFTESDKIVAFAKSHNMTVQLHHLVWGDDFVLPKWLIEGKYTKEQLLDIQQKHITNIVEHYKGQVKEYTVVNEAFTEAQHVYGLRDWWTDHIGSDMKHIDNYFIWAHQADPKAKLLLNDFNNETKNSISDAMYTYLKSARARGVPIDGIGMQMHIDASMPHKKNDVVKNMQRFGAIGVPVYVTEFDVNTNAVKGDSVYKSQLDSQITYEMTRACIESKACISFNEFGISDKQNLLKWITEAKSRSYLFDSRFRPKLSFYKFRQAWLEP